jgi:hypothetical protein
VVGRHRQRHRWAQPRYLLAGALALSAPLAGGGVLALEGPRKVPAHHAPVPSAAPVSPSPSATPSASPSPSVSPTRKPSRSPSPTPSQGVTRRFYVTLYSSRDNTPKGSRAIAYPTVHREAGGTGTFGDPITLATSRDELPSGTRVYYPYLRRYFVMEDDCVACDQDWAGDGPNGGPDFPHLDVWAGDSEDSGITACERSLTQSGQVPVVVDPPAGLPVVTAPIWDEDQGSCWRPG